MDGNCMDMQCGVQKNANDARKRQRIDSMPRSGSVSSGYESDDTQLHCQYDHLALPVVSGTDPLPYVSWETMTHLLDGKYSSRFDTVHIMDCRFPYEFEGGHIQGAQNCWTREMLMNDLLADMKYKQRVCIVFYCEFSSHRAPSQMNFLRNLDRAVHACSYPKLLCPEVYVLKSGYSNFFANAMDYCTPRSYRTMDDSTFHTQLIEATKVLKKSKKDAIDWRTTDLFRSLCSMVNDTTMIEESNQKAQDTMSQNNISFDANDRSFDSSQHEEEEPQSTRVRARLFL